jgi:hypothetical protein
MLSHRAKAMWCLLAFSTFVVVQRLAAGPCEEECGNFVSYCKTDANADCIKGDCFLYGIIKDKIVSGVNSCYHCGKSKKNNDGDGVSGICKVADDTTICKKTKLDILKLTIIPKCDPRCDNAKNTLVDAQRLKLKPSDFDTTAERVKRMLCECRS